MRKYSSSFLIILIFFTFLKPQESQAQAQMPVKAKAFLTIVGYGAAGGAILGVASLAFGTSTRAVAQGASLGLYAGILFGGYILFAHHQRRAGNYEDGSSPYQESTDVYGEGYNQEEGGAAPEEDGEGSRGGFFDRFKQMSDPFYNQQFTFQSEKKKGGNIPPIHINLIEYNF